jgi:hypothetical protein
MTTLVLLFRFYAMIDGCSTVVFTLLAGSSISRMYLLACFPVPPPDVMRNLASYIECEVSGDGSTMAEFYT